MFSLRLRFSVVLTHCVCDCFRGFRKVMVSVVLMMEVEDVVWNVGKFSSRTLMEGAEASCGDNPELNILTSMEVMVFSNVRITSR